LQVLGPRPCFLPSARSFLFDKIFGVFSVFRFVLAAFAGLPAGKLSIALANASVDVDVVVLTTQPRNHWKKLYVPVFVYGQHFEFEFVVINITIIISLNN